MQKYKIKVIEKNKEQEVTGKADQNFLEILRNHDIAINALCNGQGKCGKCKIEILDGVQKGECLACKTYPVEDCRIKIQTLSRETFHILSTGTAAKQHGDKVSAGSNLGIAADIGTTTLVMQLVDIDNGAVMKTYTALNEQGGYGADVISRIEAANNGAAEILKKSISRQLEEGVKELSKSKKAPIKRMVIAANMTMVHLLMGYSCEKLGVYPFTPVNTETIEIDFAALTGTAGESFPVIIIPGICAYVGGDIVAGLVALDFIKCEGVHILIDLGTNGEMAIGNKKKILVTSTAAGPAFEGGNISSGIGSVAGALNKATLTEGKIKYETIMGAPLVGICGSGVVELTHELLKSGLVDETGLMDEAYFDEGYSLDKTVTGSMVKFTQKDVREIQLAKSAIRAGLEMLILRYGVAYKEIEKIYIAGGFGYYLNIKKAVGIGLLPGQYACKIEAAGNSALAGAKCVLTDEAALKEGEQLAAKAEEIQLAADKEFNELYMKNMYFE